MSEWDSIEIGRQEQPAHHREEAYVQASRGRAADAPIDGLLDPISFLRMIGRNFFKILFLTILLTVVGLLAFKFVTFPYSAKAIVLVDPRQQGVKVSEQVVGDIGGDAAVLESIIEILNSDGFLRPLIKELKVADDPEFGGSSSRGNTDDRQALQAFKNGLKIQRLGATFVIEVFFTAKDPVKAAKYANAVAEAFVEQQKNFQTVATAEAASSLSDRLVGLRKTLQESEEAVAQFRTRNNLINVDNSSTLSQREMSELSGQVALAKTATEVARAQYDQVRQSSSESFNAPNVQGEARQLEALQLQRNDIRQSLAQLNLTFGERHPRIAAERSRLVALDRQIAAERRRLISFSKQQLDAALSTQRALEADMKILQKKANEDEEKFVILSELEREASANRALFEDFLGRFKSAEKQQGLQGQEAKIASAATPPLKSTRPSLALVGGVWSIVSFGLSILIVAARETVKNNRTSNEFVTVDNSLDEETESILQKLDPELAPSLELDQAPPPINKKERKSSKRSKVAKKKTRDDFHSDDFVSGPVGDAGVAYANKPKQHNKTKQSTINPNTPTLPHLAAVNYASLYDMESELADHLAQIPLFSGARMPRLILIGSWMPQEGKTLVAHAISHLASNKGKSALLLKTPVNGLVERQSGIDANQLERPYDVFDPAASHLNRDLSPKNLESFKALLKESLLNFDVVVIDSATIQEEADFNALSQLSDVTVLVLDCPHEKDVPRLVQQTLNADLANVQIVLNRM